MGSPTAPSVGTESPTGKKTEEPTAVPVTDAPTPSVPVTDAPETDAPTPSVPVTDAPETNAPTRNSTNARMLYSDGDYLGWESVAETVEVSVSAAECAYDVEDIPCKHVDAMLVDNSANSKLCQAYLDLP